MGKERTSLNTSGRNWRHLKDTKGEFGVSDLFDTVLWDVDDKIERLKGRVYPIGVWYSMLDGRHLVRHLGVDVLRKHRGCVGLLVFEHASDLVGRESVDGLRNRFDSNSMPGYKNCIHRIHTIFRFSSGDDWGACREDMLRLVSAIDGNAAVRPD